MSKKLFSKEHKDDISGKLMERRDKAVYDEALLELSENIKKSVETPVEEPPVSVKKNISYFTTTKKKRSYNIDDTSLQPTKLTMAGGRFEEKYRKQINKIVFDGDKEVDPDALLSLLILTEAVTTDRYPVYIRSSVHKSFNERIVKVLNSFFNDNLKILKEIFKMFSETTSLPKD